MKNGFQPLKFQSMALACSGTVYVLLYDIRCFRFLWKDSCPMDFDSLTSVKISSGTVPFEYYNFDVECVFYESSLSNLFLNHNYKSDDKKSL